MNPICCQCNVEMRCNKNGVYVIAKTMDGHVLNVRVGDRYKCPECTAMTVVDMGEPYDPKPGWKAHSNLKQIVVVS